MFESVGAHDFLGLSKSFSGPQFPLGIVGNQIFRKNTDTATPKPKVLSSSVEIVVAGVGKDGMPYHIEFGELEEFSARKGFNVVKRFKPFGSKFEELIVEDTGWDLSFGGAKVDWRAAYLFYANELALGGLDISNGPTMKNTVGESSSLYVAPRFKIFQAIEHYDGVIEEYVYDNVIFLDYDISIAADNQTIPERFNAFASSRFTTEVFKNHETIKIMDSVGQMLEIIKENGRF